ncbi:MAG TPA: glycosyltransferase family 2 protein, partial [Flavisolibacter sp.]|nr:glycosyltransferase family 2 protein [Flavisolibacter sp.]
MILEAQFGVLFKTVLLYGGENDGLNQIHMNEKISIVVVCKNEAGVIERLLKNAQGISDDVVIYDNGSTDGTIELAKQYKVHLHQGEWLGFGKTKQKAVRLAKYDWILSLDADESLDEVLQKELKNLSFDSAKTVYDIPFKNFLGNKHLKWGE